MNDDDREELLDVIEGLAKLVTRTNIIVELTPSALRAAVILRKYDRITDDGKWASAAPAQDDGAP